MGQEKIIINEDANGEYMARIYDGTMRVFCQQHIKTRKAAFSAVRKFLKEQEAKIESGELLELN
jgi:hypothetical protein